MSMLVDFCQGRLGGGGGGGGGRTVEALRAGIGAAIFSYACSCAARFAC